jgi:hypothetical protein
MGVRQNSSKFNFGSFFVAKVYVNTYINPMTLKSSPASLMAQAAQIPHLERGKLSIIRQGPNGPYYNHQFPQDGKYVTRYVPRDQAAAVQQAIDGCKEFDRLMERYVDEMVQKTRTEIAAGSKKNKIRRHN